MARTDKPANGTLLDLEQVRTRAYEIFLARGDRPGDALSDWLQAEQELRSAPVHNSKKASISRRTSRGTAHPRGASNHDEWDLEPLDALIARRRQARAAQMS